MATDEPVIVKIVEKVAAREGVDPETLHPPLHSVIDTDALEALFHASGHRQATTTATLEFIYKGYTVRVDSPGHVHVRDPLTVNSVPRPVEKTSQ